MPYADPERQRAFKREWRQNNADSERERKRAYRARDRENRAGLRNKTIKPKSSAPSPECIEHVERTEPRPVSLPALRIPTLDEIATKYGK
jgi:hypothetical protein